MRKASILQYQLLATLHELGGTADRATLGRRINAAKLCGLTDNTWYSVVKRGWITCQGGAVYDYDAVLSLTEDGCRAIVAGAAPSRLRLSDKRARVLKLISQDLVTHRTNAAGREVWESSGRTEVTDQYRWLEANELAGTVGGKVAPTAAGREALCAWLEAQQRARLRRLAMAGVR